MTPRSKVIEWVQRCLGCDGTGLYIGRAERDGVAVVCRECRGTGKRECRIEYEEFVGRERRPNVERVVQVNPGVRMGEVNGSTAWVGGMTYEDWLAGKPFVPGMEMREHTCPAEWYQSANYALKPQWDWCSGFWGFPNCRHFVTKSFCWRQWDLEFGGKGHE